MIARLFDDYSKIETLFGRDWSFCWYLILIDYWQLRKRRTGICWARGTNFQGHINKLDYEKAIKKIKYYNLCTKLKVCRRCQGKTSSINLKLGLTSRNCDLSYCLSLLPLFVGWDIMGHESDPLPYYNELRNRSYSIMLNYIDYLSTHQIHVPRPDPTI